MLEAQFLAETNLFVPRGGGAIEDQVGAQEFSGTQQHGTVQACAEITDGGTCRHRHQQGEEQYA